MPNINGLSSVAPVFNTGSEDSAFWAKKENPDIVGGLVTLFSPDGGAYATFEESDQGVLTISTSDDEFGDIVLENTGNIYLQPGATLSGIEPPARAVYVGLTQGDATLIVKNDNAGTANGTCQLVLEDTSSNGKKFEMASTAGSVFISDTTDNQGVLSSDGATMSLIANSVVGTVFVGSAPGRLYDTVYNPVASITVLQPLTTGNIVYDVAATRPAGIYQLQLSVETLVTTGAATNVLSMFVSAPPATEVINFSGAEIAPSAVGALLCMNSGYFTHAGGSMRVQVRAIDGINPGTPWTGDWVLQLVKIG